MPETNLSLKPIGFVHSEQKNRYEAARQGILSSASPSLIELLPNRNFEQGLIALEGFERIWVIFQFHKNGNWKPMVQPPRHTAKKIGVFASRAPYRPNPLGLSCVRLLKIEGLKLYITESDILDGSPVFDIKPYLPYADSFPDVKTGWVKTDIRDLYAVEYDELAAGQIAWLRKEADINLRGFSQLQLEFNPADNSRKRIQKCIGTENTNSYILSYRTWRIQYQVWADDRKVIIQKVFSGYSVEELANAQEDKYEDKELHQKFKAAFL